MFAFAVNALAVVVGSIIGLIVKTKIKEETCQSVLKAVGLVVLIIGILGVLENMVIVLPTGIKTEGALALIICLTLGTLIGELLKIDHHLNDFSDKIEKKINKGKIAEGFVTASLMYCVGSMTIIGSMESAFGNPNTIYLKSVIDLVTSIALASTLGLGVMLSSITVFIYQGLLTLLFVLLHNFMPNDFITLISMVGYVSVMAIGLNLLIKDKIKVANMLPAFIVAIVYYLISSIK